jgi:arsenate reductase
VTDDRARVLFVCIGNSCRSQMAEAFARTYGSDVLIPASAGIAPAASVSRSTSRLMREKNIDLSRHAPKAIQSVGSAEFELVVNMSGVSLGQLPWPVREWAVRDPISLSEDEHRAVRDQIELLVMKLILELRREQKNRLETAQ